MATVNLHITQHEADIIARDFDLRVEQATGGIFVVTGDRAEVEEAADIYDTKALRDVRS